MFNICFNSNLLKVSNKCLYYNVNNCFKSYKIFNKKNNTLRVFFYLLNDLQ